jgi:hypothetical protein
MLEIQQVVETKFHMWLLLVVAVETLVVEEQVVLEKEKIHQKILTQLAH